MREEGGEAACPVCTLLKLGVHISSLVPQIHLTKARAWGRVLPPPGKGLKAGGKEDNPGWARAELMGSENNEKGKAVYLTS